MASKNSNLDQKETLDLLFYDELGYHSTEEISHPWRVQGPEGPLLRFWDEKVGSELIDGSMKARAPRQRLHDRESRVKFLTTHLDYRDWTPTPFISFTTRQDEIENLAGRRIYTTEKTVIVIDPHTRLKKGLPIIDVEAETKHYRIEDHYPGSKDYARGHYMCLWEVTKDEIVGSWKWDDLKDNKNWLEDIIMPEYKKFLGKTALTTLEASFQGLSVSDDATHVKDTGSSAAKQSDDKRSVKK
ncbi:hypothetical protein F4774DRAFT_376920 [Daldinia eschscholtzii]|nr:hypothetical protein F4774DRAFT_376920 [Daldinia eschscholtzii]